MDSDDGKIFVSGISQDTDENLLRAYFSQFGEVLDVKMIRDQATGHNVGFAFVAFSDPAAVDRVLQDRHEIDNQYVDVKRTTSGEVHNPAGRSGNLNSSRSFDIGVNVRDNRIFVGGLPPSLTSEQLRAYFEAYATVSDAVIVIDQLTQRPRGFGFVSFDSEDSVNLVLHKSFHYLNGKRVDVKRAHSSKNSNPGVASGGGAAGGFPVYGGSEGSGYEGCMNSNKYMQPQNTGSGYFPYGGGAGTSSGGGRAGAASGGGGAGAFPGYGGSSGSGYEGRMDSNRYMQLQNTGSGYYPPYGASGYGHGGYGGIGGYGNPAGAPYGNPGVPGTSGPRSAWGGQVPSGYGYGGNDPSYRTPSAYGVVDGQSGNIHNTRGSGSGYADASNDSGSGYPPSGASGYGYGGSGGYGYSPYDVSGYNDGSYGVGYGGYPAGAPYGNPGVPGTSGPRSAWGAQVPSGYGNVEYGNAAPSSAGLGSAVMEQVGGSAYGGNDSWYGTPSAYGAVDGQSGNIHNTHGSSSGYADASNGSRGYGNHQRNNRQAGSGGSFGKDRQAQQ